MRQSLSDWEQAFVKEILLDRRRRASLQRTAEQRARKRQVDRRHRARLPALRDARAHADHDRRDRHGRDVPHALPAAWIAPGPAPAPTPRPFRAARRPPRPRVPSCPHALDLLAVDLQVDLLAEHRNLLGRLNADPHLLAHHRKHRDLDVVPDHDALVGLARQDQQFGAPFLLPTGRPARAPNTGMASIVTGPGERFATSFPCFSAPPSGSLNGLERRGAPHARLRRDAASMR